MTSAVCVRSWRALLVLAIVGGGLSFAFAMTRPEVYESSATLFYQRRSGPYRCDFRHCSLVSRYQDVLSRRATLERIIHDRALAPYPELDDELAIERLQPSLHFEELDDNTFRIRYTDRDPERARAIASLLSDMFQAADVTGHIAYAGKMFTDAAKSKAESREELENRQRTLVDFFITHPGDHAGLSALKDLVDEQRRIDTRLADAVDRANILAAQMLAEPCRLHVIDSASLPREPVGVSRSSVLAVCLLVVIGLGLLLPGPRLLAYE